MEAYVATMERQSLLHTAGLPLRERPNLAFDSKRFLPIGIWPLTLSIQNSKAVHPWSQTWHSMKLVLLPNSTSI